MKNKIISDGTLAHTKDCPSRHSGECLCGVFEKSNKPTHTPTQLADDLTANGWYSKKEVERIVRAVNSHQELIDLLKETRELGKTDTAWKIWDSLRDKAIAKAEGK